MVLLRAVMFEREEVGGWWWWWVLDDAIRCDAMRWVLRRGKNREELSDQSGCCVGIGAAHFSKRMRFIKSAS